MRQLWAKSKSRFKPPQAKASVDGSNDFPCGIKVLYSPPEDCIVDIVFVHGLTGHREKTWTAEGAAASWPQTLLPAKIPDARILTFGYDASVGDWRGVVSQNRVGNHSWNLLTGLASFREEDDTNDRPIIFVCHSLGGLVCEDALFISDSRTDQYLHNVISSTVGIAFLGTPHHGSGLALGAERLARAFGLVKQMNADVVQVLRRDSEVLARIQDSFHNIVISRNKAGNLPLGISCFYEELPLPGIGPVVPKESAILPGYISIGIHANHMDMARFTSAEDPGFLSICGVLRQWIKSLSVFSAFSEEEPGRDLDPPDFPKPSPPRLFHSKRGDAPSASPPANPRQPPTLSSVLGKDFAYVGKVHEACTESFGKLSSMNTVDYFETISTPEGDTFQWILRDPVFLGYLRDNGPGILQVWGKPGGGKSVLAKHLFHVVLQQLKAQGDAKRDIYLTFFSCSAGEEGRRTAKNILGSLIHQCLAFVPIPKAVLKLYPQDLSKAADWEWTARLLCKAFKETVKAFTENNVQLVCIIDGLDECKPGSDLKSLLETLASVFSTSTSTMFSSSKTSSHKLITLSRQYHRLALLKPSVRSIDLDKVDAMDGDLATYIRSEVGTFLETRPAFRTYENLIVEALEQRADRMFLFVKLLVATLPNLADSSPSAVKKALQALPSTLEEIYTALWDQTVEEHGATVLQLAGWIACAYHPFTVTELALIIAHDRVLTEGESLARLEDYTPVDLRGDLLRLFGPLIRDSHSHVQFCHLTVKEFMLRQMPASAIHKAQYSLAQICARAIDGAETTGRNSFESADSLITILGGNGEGCEELYPYAVSHWAHHYSDVKKLDVFSAEEVRQLQLRG